MQIRTEATHVRYLTAGKRYRVINTINANVVSIRDDEGDIILVGLAPGTCGHIGLGRGDCGWEVVDAS